MKQMLLCRIFSVGWYTELLKKSLKRIPREKLVVGLGNYAYDWNERKKRADSLTFQEVLITAKDNRPDEKPAEIIDFDPSALNPTFSYRDDGNNMHEVWFLDAVTAANQWEIAQKENIQGAVLWVLGSEDPSIWSFFDHERISKPMDMTQLDNMSYPYDVSFIGEGDILRIKSMPQKGLRTIDIDQLSGLCTDETYEAFPSAFVFERNGLQPKMVALTFDDGPYEPYTSEILDKLKQLGIYATFFCIGENLERHPDVAERIWEEGHEIGNHSWTHPNMGEISETRARMELNSTDRILQSILGRSTILFRAPFNADAEPTSAEEVWPIVFASKFGYITVGEYIDPQDWNLTEILPNGKVKHRTSKDIADNVIQLIHEGHGNAVLLHDGGGDRSQTVAAVEPIVKTLSKEGYKFVKVSELMNTTRDTIMPRVNSKDNVLIGVDRIVFEITYLFEVLLHLFFIIAIILGTLKVIFIITLALFSRKREKKNIFNDKYHPFVSVVIACYNEEKVIEKTVHAVLENKYEPLEIVLIDDGSKDNTFNVAQSLFGNNPKIRIIRQENLGKAAALNKGIEQTSGAIIICLDADTIFERDTISKLIRHFADKKVGAVAGNVKVGNRINILTYWQEIEYITSQNIDRRAYSYMNAITVVPGAVGAWRREAVLGAGDFRSDTLAEDMDLTWRLRQNGWRIENETQAFGYTETPDTLKTLFKQRFRWTFGTLQCLWKHRDMLGRFGGFGWVMMPSLWLFQIVFQLLSPIIDFTIFWTVITSFHYWLLRGVLRFDWQPFFIALGNLSYIAFMYVFFFLIELAGALVAFSLEKENKKLLFWLFFQRFFYRQIMYAVAIKSFKTALHGIHIGWGKLERKGTAKSAYNR
ncbi:MAG: glycosyltransferase [Elusimicrobia bacterium]|nr:glycosyltransferase [Elusimicrobiota bacterium]